VRAERGPGPDQDLFPSTGAPRPLRPVAGDPGTLATEFGGEPVELLAERALFWPRAATLLVADLHLGKAASLRAGGVPVPRGATASDLDRLSALLRRTGATRIVVLGDLIHAATGRVPALDAAVRAWRERHPNVALTLVRGNHDQRAGDPPTGWQIEVVSAPYPLAGGPFVLHHEPAVPPTGYALCGHLHPGVRLTGSAGDSVRLPCFVLGARSALLPAFGRLTGLWLVPPRPGETRVAVAGGTLYPLPDSR
jgi:DNA ligase-associated metallophosphoesterase